MSQKDIIYLLDQHIIVKSLSNGVSLMELNRNMNSRIKIMFGIASKKFGSIEELLNCNDIEKYDDTMKYAYHFLCHAIKRLSDIHWMYKNRDKFKDYSDVKLFKLIIFKEKLEYEIHWDSRPYRYKNS
jgi:hypothetical protein